MVKKLLSCFAIANCFAPTYNSPATLASYVEKNYITRANFHLENEVVLDRNANCHIAHFNIDDAEKTLSPFFSSKTHFQILTYWWKYLTLTGAKYQSPYAYFIVYDPNNKCFSATKLRVVPLKDIKDVLANKFAKEIEQKLSIFESESNRKMSETLLSDTTNEITLLMQKHSPLELKGPSHDAFVAAGFTRLHCDKRILHQPGTNQFVVLFMVNFDKATDRIDDTNTKSFFQQIVSVLEYSKQTLLYDLVIFVRLYFSDGTNHGQSTQLVKLTLSREAIEKTMFRLHKNTTYDSKIEKFFAEFLKYNKLTMLQSLLGDYTHANNKRLQVTRSINVPVAKPLPVVRPLEILPNPAITAAYAAARNLASTSHTAVDAAIPAPVSVATQTSALVVVAVPIPSLVATAPPSSTTRLRTAAINVIDSPSLVATAPPASAASSRDSSPAHSSLDSLHLVVFDRTNIHQAPSVINEFSDPSTPDAAPAEQQARAASASTDDIHEQLSSTNGRTSTGTQTPAHGDEPQLDNHTSMPARVKIEQKACCSMM